MNEFVDGSNSSADETMLLAELNPPVTRTRPFAEKCHRKEVAGGIHVPDRCEGMSNWIVDLSARYGVVRRGGPAGD